MKQSQLFTKTLREPPKGEQSINAKLLERGGFVYKNSAGIYSFLPLGLSVFQKVADIIRDEMNAISGQEMLMPALVGKHYLDVTGRWDVEIGYEVKGKGDSEPDFVLGWTHEEVLTEIASRYVNSYRDLPFSAYQIQTKFRNEPRAKSGLLRGREFVMKDLYSFHANEKDLAKYYKRVKKAYEKIFARCGLETVYTIAAGGPFTASRTHEFQVLTEVGEDTVFWCSKCQYAENKEISELKSGDKCPECGGKIEEEKGIEVGNLFPLGTKYSEGFNLKFVNRDGKADYVVMGSYGIGLGRVIGAVVEVHHDEKGIIWPQAIAPFAVHILELDREGSKDVGELAKEAEKTLLEAGITVLYDDRKESAGLKFGDSDLLGIPFRVVVSPKSALEGRVEIKKRNEDRTKLVKVKELVQLVKS